jgi:hypothetical protein
MKQNYIFFITAALWISASATAGQESMPHMPRMAPKKTYTVKTQEEGTELLERRGYGDQEPMVRMMNLMMVGGSGYEGMDMGEMTAASSSDIKKADSEHAAMAKHDSHMEQGMEGMKHAALPVPRSKEDSIKSFDLETQITSNPPQVGSNVLVVKIKNKQNSKPAQGLKIEARVYMTSMDMGTEEPVVHETSPGMYQTKVIFTMNGPWAVKLTLPDGQENTLNFEVKPKK